MSRSAAPPFLLAPIPERLPDGIEWVFFDFDGTLWDHALASLRALTRLCAEFSLPADAFIPLFEEANQRAWAALAEGRTTRERMRLARFAQTLAALDPALPASTPVEQLSRRYLGIYLEGPAAYWIRGARATLRATRRAGLRTAVLTNGFSDIQAPKLRSIDEGRRMEFLWGPDEAGEATRNGEGKNGNEEKRTVVTRKPGGPTGAGEDACDPGVARPCLKPRAEFFMTALARARCAPERALMIGDSMADDILPARALGLHAWWFNARGGEAANKKTVDITDCGASRAGDPLERFSRLREVALVFNTRPDHKSL